MAKCAGAFSASGMDVKNFCAAPASALVTAGALIKAGLYERIVVVAGGSLAKLGMKSMAFIPRDVPHTGRQPRLHGVSGHPQRRRESDAAPGSPEQSARRTSAPARRTRPSIEQLILKPLRSLGLTMADVDRFAPELHNPEIMEYYELRNVAHKNYRMIPATAVLAGEIDRAGMSTFT